LTCMRSGVTSVVVETSPRNPMLYKVTEAVKVGSVEQTFEGHQ